ncbi:hypothetical protein PWY87_21740 [Kribbella solani]|uniref:hypothetical protein n=1 Tax=Kribbella solani TaxID=236067 RepID=UPI0029A06DC7|nr:hypothetical protein [Kribbella solani]MDX3004325.1 hypothetical protein [Kribbella solani]
MSGTTVSDRATLPRGVTDLRRLKHVVNAMTQGLRQMLVGYWVVMLVALLGVGIVIALLTGGVKASVWDYGTQSPKYFSMAIGITLTPAFFTLLIAQGVTRRMYSVASGIYLTGTAAATALLWLLAYQAEHALYAGQGWPDKLTNPHLFTNTSQGELIFAEFFLMILAHEVTGWLLGITFFRLGFWRGVLLLPVSLVPAVAAELLLVAQWLADLLRNTGYQRPPLAIAIPSVLIVSALGVYTGYRLLLPLAPKPAKG